MSNSYYNYSGNFIPGTLARAEAIAAEYSSVATGFSKLSIQGTDTGTANHYAFATPGYPVAAYQDGNNVQFKALNTNTGASDVNVNGIGIVPLTRFNGAALLAGDVSAGSWYTAVYQVAFGAFTIISPAAYTTFAGTISGAAPANKVGLVAAGGSATSAIPIDATLAIDQAIIPTWTGLHTFNGKVVVGAPASGVGLTVTGVAGASAAQFLTTGVQIGSPTGGDKGSGTLNVASGLYVNGTLVASGAVVTSIVAGTAISISGATGAVTVNNTGVTSITGTANQIAASASTGAVTLSMPQNVIVPTPAAGTALTVTSAGANTAAAIFNTASASFSATANGALILNNVGGSQTPLDFQFGGVLGARVRADSSNNIAIVATGSGNLSLYTGGDSGVGGQRIAITSAGNVTVNAPSSGIALTVNGVSTNFTAAFVSGVASNISQEDVRISRAGSTINQVQQGPNLTIRDTTNTTITCLQNSGGQTELWQYNGGWGQRLVVDTSGNINIANGTGSLSPVYAGIPQNSQGGNYTLVLADANKHIYVFGAGTVTIPANSSVAYPIGTAITIINGNIGGNLSIAITTDTLRLANSASTGTRTLANNGVATIIKISATIWYSSGSGLT